MLREHRSNWAEMSWRDKYTPRLRLQLQRTHSKHRRVLYCVLGCSLSTLLQITSKMNLCINIVRSRAV